MIKIVIAGDFYPKNRVKESIDSKQFDGLIDDPENLIKGSDYSLINLEGPIIANSSDKIKKIGPHHKITPISLEFLKYSGFNAVTLANNHMRDYSTHGVMNTINQCENFNIDWVGAGQNIGSLKKTLYKNIKSKKVAFINFCENEFSIATNKSAGSNPLDIINIYNCIKDAKKQSDYIIILSHGGIEGYQLPTPEMKKLFRFLIELGADAVINHHQHVFSGYEVYMGKPILYGLGNFSFDEINPPYKYWNTGILSELFITEKKISFKNHFYKQDLKTPGIKFIKNKTELKKLNNEVKEFNKIIDDRILLEKYFRNFIKSNSTHSKLIFEPYCGRIMKSLYYRGFLPSFFERNKIKILSQIQCESHRNRLIKLLKSE